MSAIEVLSLSKVFRVPKKAPGLKASIKGLIRREWIIKQAVSEVSLKVESGEILGLIGANGAGKTTLVKMLSGIIHPTSGSASVLGYRPWERSNALRKQIALIMGQKAQLWWDLPAADCFLLLRQIYQIPDAGYDSHLDYLVQSLDVKHVLHVPIRRLSLGERMKVELIAALLHQPKVVFLDEPTIGLDLNAQRALRQFLLEYRKSHNPAMILTSHYMEDIERLCERVLIIREGAIIYDGSLKKIVAKHVTGKVLTVTIGDSNGAQAPFSFPAELGQVIEQDGSRIRIRCDRSLVNDAATYLLKNLKAEDLAIAEDDIGTIIASLLGGEKRAKQ